jgi:hypothetical protein
MAVKIALCACLVASIIPPIASDAQTNDGSPIQKFIKSDFYKGLVDRAMAGLPQAVFRRCPALVSDDSRVTVLKPIVFGADGWPNAGSWKQQFPVKGCGNDTVLNIYVSAGADEKINTVIGIPGSTRADLTLQRDAVLYANTWATMVAKGCKSFDVTDTKFEGFRLSKPAAPDPGPDNHFRPWRETWTLIGCGVTIDIPIDFVPDAKGTQVIRAADVVERQPGAR